MKNKNLKCYEYIVDGMHCAACELLIEDKLKDFKGVKTVRANLSESKVIIEIDTDKDKEYISNDLSRLVASDGYSIKTKNTGKDINLGEFIYAVPIAIIFLLLFAILQTSGILSTGTTTDLFQTFVLGVIASLSSCMALIGGLVLALSNKYIESESENTFTSQVSFHLGRLISFFLLGGALGLLGGLLNPSLGFTFGLTILVSFIMVVLGVNQLGIFKELSYFQIKTPKMLSKNILSLKNLNHSYIPFILGALTFFLPCGFTLSVQALALEQGNFIDSALIMFSFALGTFPVLGLLSFASVNFAGKLKSGIFLKTTGIIIIVFALYNIYGALVANGLI